MWIFFPEGFVSAVSHREQADTVIVRARAREHLIAFANYEPAPPHTRHPKRTVDADYLFRFTMSRVEYAATVASIAARVDYDNFKNECAERKAPRVWLSALHKVWSILYSFQDHTSAHEG